MLTVIMVCVIIFALLAVLLRKTLMSVFSLAAVSVFLSAAFFELGSPAAGVFELSVGAGLITVLIVLTLTFIQKRKESAIKANYIWIALSLAAAALFVYFFYHFTPESSTGETIPASSWTAVGEVMWKQRIFDLLPQALIVLSAVFGILALLRKENHKEVIK